LYDSSGQFRAKLKIAELDAPPSVRLVVAQRLARLSDLTQKMLATAAVIGRSFSFEILQASSEADADSLLECIEEAEKAGLVLSVAESPKARFEFSHELVRQAVIGGVSAARRQRLHFEVAEAIERIHAEALEDHWAELAHHYRLGGDGTKAIGYLIRAAGQAAARSAHREAISLATVALELLAATPNNEERDRRELSVQRILILSYYVITGWAAPEVERATLRSLELSERINATRAAIGSRMGLVLYYCQRADYERAAVFRHQLLELVSTVPDHRLKSEIHVSIGVALTSQGELEEARRQLEQGILLSEADPFVPGSGLGQPACAGHVGANHVAAWLS
jgi:predicted ATPase